jgi:hypothetical protein
MILLESSVALAVHGIRRWLAPDRPESMTLTVRSAPLPFTLADYRSVTVTLVWSGGSPRNSRSKIALIMSGILLAYAMECD